MRNDCPAGQGHVVASGRRGRLLPRLLASLLLVSLILPAGGASGSTLRPAPVARGGLSTGTTLAVVRAEGASLYDDSGRQLLDLPSGTALRVSGRSADSRWFYGTTRDGSTGWVGASRVMIFGVSNVPTRDGFSGPAPSGAADSSAPNAPATANGKDTKSEPAVDLRLQAVVESGSLRLNVRSGPGTTYSVIGAVANGTVLTGSARNEAADWIRIEGTTIPGGSGWVSAGYLALQGRALDLPVAATVAGAVPRTSAPITSSSRLAGLTGKLVFQESSGGKIDVYDLSGGELLSLTTGADPAVSPDGRTVTFWRRDGTGYRIFLIVIDGKNERRILTRDEQVRTPAWSPDGGKIVFSHVNGEQRCRDAGYGVCMPDTYPYNLMLPLRTIDAWGLARVDRDGGDYLDLASTANATSPDWSVLGIVYSGPGVQVTQDVVDDSSNRVVLSEYRYQDPAAQPGGDLIAFHTLEKDHWEIFSAQADGSNVTALTRPETTLITPLPHNVAPAWSPDGRNIVFLSNRTGKWQLWVMDADGEEPRALPVEVPIEYTYRSEQVVTWTR